MMKILSILTLSLFIASAHAQTTHQQREYESIQKLKSTVKDLSKIDLRCNTSRACDAVALGEKICGGPAEFAVISKNNFNSKEIRYLAKRTRIREQDYNIKYPEIGDCEYIEKPITRCINHQCLRLSEP